MTKEHKDTIAEVIKWLAGVAIAAFLAGVSALQFVDSRIKASITPLEQKIDRLIATLPPDLDTFGQRIAKLEGERLECVAYPTEENRRPPECGAGSYEFANWCSGNCDGDDARVRICCKP